MPLMILLVVVSVILRFASKFPDVDQCLLVDNGVGHYIEKKGVASGCEHKHCVY